jgi:hypothetical protein
MADNSTPRKEDIRKSKSLILSAIVVGSSLLPVIVPGILAYAMRDRLMNLVDARPQSGWLGLIASILVLALQIWMTRRSTFRICFENLRMPAQEIVGYIWLCRFSVAMLAMVAVTFLAVPQGEESLRTLFEHAHRYDFWYSLRACFFHGCVILFSLALWFSSRYLVDRFRSENRGSSIQINFPRILGAMGSLIPALALHQASYAYLGESYPVTRTLLILPAFALFFVGPRLFPGLLLGLGVIYLAAYIPNIWIVDRGGVEEHAWHSLNRAALIEVFLGSLLSWFFVGHRSLREAQGIRAGAATSAAAQPADKGKMDVDAGDSALAARFEALSSAPSAHPRGSASSALAAIQAIPDFGTHGSLSFPRIWGLCCGAFILILAVITVFPEVPGSLNAAGILIFACASWISIGSMLTSFSEKPPGQTALRARPLPVFTALIAALVGFGLINDNHPVRQLGRLPLPAPLEPNLHAYIGHWLGSSGERCPEAAGGPQPMVLVAAEGGGIRAAYWTASVLSALQDRYPCFASGVAGLSGVSGGSVGSAVFAAQVAHRIGLAPGAPRPQCEDYDGASKDTYLACSRRMLGRDFLSPTLAYLLFPDLVQRFLPFPVAFFDRGAALEQAWERSWKATFKTSDYFAAPFDSLWRNGGPAWRVPALFLNGTWAENGWRLISAPVQLGREEVSAARNVFDLSDHPLRLSTAAHVSARFTYVSPAGTLVRDGQVAGHVVDGAYFENSGSATAGEILNASRGLLDSAGYRLARARDTVDVVPIMLVIRFQEHAPRDCMELSCGWVPKPQLILKESTVPLKTLMNTRTARGDFSLDAIRIQILRVARLQRPQAPPAKVLEATLRETQVPLPLGWSLSEVAQEEMAHQLEGWLKDSDAIRYLDGIFAHSEATRMASRDAAAFR